MKPWLLWKLCTLLIIVIQVCLTLSYIQDHCHGSCSCHTNCKHQNAGSRSLNPWIRNGAHTLSTAPPSTRDYSNPIPVTTHKETFHEDLKQSLCWIFSMLDFISKVYFEVWLPLYDQWRTIITLKYLYFKVIFSKIVALKGEKYQRR